MQAPAVRLDHVTLTLGYLYKVFSEGAIEDSVKAGVLGSLEKRWMKNADHDVFIMAVFLNPYLRMHPFRLENPALTPMALYNMARRVYTRMFERDPDAGFHVAFWNYTDGKGRFSPEDMHLDGFKAAYEEQVSRQLHQ